MAKEVQCDYCGCVAEFVDSAEVYHGRSYGMIYLCRKCNAYVGVHKDTDEPLGKLANAELRKWKMAAHDSFDLLWRNECAPFYRKRKEAYKWLSEQLGLPKDQTHIGMFDIDKCKQVIAVCANIK